MGDRQAIQREYDRVSQHLQKLRSDCDMQRGSLGTVLERVRVTGARGLAGTALAPCHGEALQCRWAPIHAKACKKDVLAGV